MHPAFSVLFLTTLIGAGQGLFLALVTAQLYGGLGLAPIPSGSAFHAPATLLALALLGGGLLASFFHLGHPERAWRTITRWRTSWLSREVILLPLFMLFTALYGGAHLLGPAPLPGQLGGMAIDLSLAVGLLGAVVCFALFLATGMIYAGVRFLQTWATPLTVANFTLMGIASGFTLATGAAALLAPELVRFFTGWAILFTLLALVGRTWSLWRNGRIVPKSTPQSAIGVRHGAIRQLTQGFVGDSFNTREFFHRRSPATLQAVKWQFLTLGFGVPLLLLGAGQISGQPLLLQLAFPVQWLGLMGERWFFFAQANHPQNLFYQRGA